MGVVLQNDSIVGGIDSSLIAKIGSDPLQTEAQDLSGAVNELVNSVGSDVSVTQKVSSGENIASITVDGTTTELYATNTTYSDFVGATSETDGSSGLVIAPTTSDADKYLKGDGTWGTPPDTTYTAATALPGDINTTGAVGVSTDYARQDHTHKIALATGDDNGQVKIAGTNVSVKGLDNSAYKDYTTSVTQGSTDLVTSGAVFTAIDDLPEPMVYKGTLGTNGTITDLPTASDSNEGFTYKVITAGTYASQAANVGDAFTSNGSEWVRFPAGDPDTDTWRNIKVNGVEKLASGISSGAVDFVNGTNTTVAFDATGNTITVNATDTTYSDFTGATAQTAGAHGLVPAPATTDVGKFLSADGTWGDGGRPMVVLSYGNSTWNDFINAYNNNVIVYCRASSNANPATGAQTRMAFMAYVSNDTNPTNVEFQYYRSVNTHSATQQGDQVFVYKLDKTAGWSVTTRQASSKVAAGTNMTLTYANDTITLSATDTTYSDFGGATSQQAGSAGLVPAPTTSDTAKFLKGDGTWGAASTSDVNVTQTPVSTDADYRVLLSGSADDTAHTEGTSKDSGFKYNPNKHAIIVGTREGIEYGATVGEYSSSFGIGHVASGDYSFAQGNDCEATGTSSHAEGVASKASGHYSHTEGSGSKALGNYSHAEGNGTIANHKSQHVFGEYNIEDANASTSLNRGDYVEIVGNGSASTRSNARTLDWNGNEVLAGKLTVGTAPTANMDVATKKYVDDAIDVAITQVLATPF